MTNTDSETMLNVLKGMSGEKMPVKIGFTIAKNIRALDEAVNLYHDEINRIILQYSSDGKSVKPSDEGFAECKGKLEDLAQLDADITLETIDLSEVEDLSLTLEQITALMEMSA